MEDIANLLTLTFRVTLKALFTKTIKRFNFSDLPLKSANKVDYYPTSDDISTMTDWCLFFISKALTEYHPAMKSCKRFLK